MAAVLCLILLPLISAVGFMFLVAFDEMSIGSAFACAAFILMSAGLFVGMFNMARDWEEEKASNH